MVLVLFMASIHDDIIKWKHFPLYWSFVQGIHQSPVNSPHKGQWRGALMFSFICAGINGWVNNGEAGDLGRHRAHFDVIIMFTVNILQSIMMTSVNKTKLPHHADVIKWKKKSALLALCERNPVATDGPLTKASFDVFFDLRLNKPFTERTIETPAIWNAIALVMTSS